MSLELKRMHLAQNVHNRGVALSALLILQIIYLT
jgi:hypothetical protein